MVECIVCVNVPPISPCPRMLYSLSRWGRHKAKVNYLCIIISSNSPYLHLELPCSHDQRYGQRGVGSTKKDNHRIPIPVTSRGVPVG